MNIFPIAVIACIASTAAHAQDMKDILNDSLSTIDALNAQLDTIKDKASADSAATKVAEIAKKYAEITQQLLKATPPATPEAMAQIADIQTKSQETMGKFQANMMRLQKEQLMTPELLKAIAGMNPQSAPAK